MDRIVERRDLLREQADGLRKQLEDIDVELDQLAVAEQVIARLLADDEPGNAEPDVDAEPDPLSLPPGMTVPHRRQARGVSDLPGEYQRFLELIAASPRPAAFRYVREQLGVPIAAKNIEGMRSKLKRLVERGWLIETQPGKFTVRP
ncbi:hypothetical protein [Kitasatospora paracochleata]|uniref:Uncharacterized protein n=1 Tax=Kitasatospora paracochleata TaxID=58354 RepID=A0ABT1J9E9_9ACTN|nr:hypothetical protein [Kitasatospora paracochleata]MCP2313998.1 hypothetical protein [Kitasatospora paracochleata]